MDGISEEVSGQQKKA